MRHVLVLVLILTAPLYAYPSVIHVPKDYLTLQEAIDAASQGDTVIAAAGTYVERIDFLGKAITVTSSAGSGTTVIDGSKMGSVVTMKTGEGPDSIIAGFTITNGKAEEGGGIFCESSSPTIRDNVIALNDGTFGGAVFCRGASPLIQSNTLKNNEVYRGGGVYCEKDSAPLVLDNFIFNNKNTPYK